MIINYFINLYERSRGWFKKLAVTIEIYTQNANLKIIRNSRYNHNYALAGVLFVICLTYHHLPNRSWFWKIFSLNK